MDAKTLKKFLSLVIPKRASLAILRYAWVENGQLRATDLDQELIVDIESDRTGLLDCALFSKTLSIDNSIVPMSENRGDEFPKAFSAHILEGLKEVEVDPSAFPENLSRWLPYAPPDEARGCLTGVCISSKSIVATNGHVLLAEPAPGIAGVELILPATAVKMLDAIGAIDSAFARHRVATEADSDTGTSSVEYDYLTVRAGGVAYTVKLLDGPYPQWSRVVPDPADGSSLRISRATVLQLIAACDKLRPFAHDETRLAVLQSNEIFVHNRYTQKHVRISLQEKIFGHENLYCIGVNIDYFKLFLQDAIVGRESIDLNFRTAISAITVQDGGRVNLIMPLKLLPDVENWDNSKPYPTSIEPEYIEVEAPKTTKPKAEKLDRKAERILLDIQNRIGKKALLDLVEGLELVA